MWNEAALNQETPESTVHQQALDDSIRVNELLSGEFFPATACGIEAAKRERDRFSEAAVAALTEFGPEAAMLRAAARFAANRKS